MTCLTSEHLTICVPHVDAWSRFFTRCPVCRVRRLCLEEFQDWYGSRCLCLTCGTDWMEGEYRKCAKRERAETVTKAKARIKYYLATGFEQGYQRFFARLDHEQVLRMITSGQLLASGEGST